MDGAALARRLLTCATACSSRGGGDVVADGQRGGGGARGAKIAGPWDEAAATDFMAVCKDVIVRIDLRTWTRRRRKIRRALVQKLRPWPWRRLHGCAQRCFQHWLPSPVARDPRQD
jgi:hypothetical protein